MRIERLKHWSASNWFALVAPALVLVAWLASRSIPWAEHGAAMEAALLLDACVTLPVLYALCYAGPLPLWQLAIRMIGIACLGIYGVSCLVPADAQSLLPSFGWGRSIGLAVLILVELRIFLAVVRAVFKTEVTAEQLAIETGAPPLLAKLMMLEARMWKSLWRFFQRR